MQSARADSTREQAIASLVQLALDTLPVSDAKGGLTRGEAERPDHAAHRLLRAMAAMVLPVVDRLVQLDAANQEAHDEMRSELDDLRESVGAA